MNLFDWLEDIMHPVLAKIIKIIIIFVIAFGIAHAFDVFDVDLSVFFR